MFRPESWSCRSTAEWECTWYHRWLPMNGCNRIRTIFVSLFTGKKSLLTSLAKEPSLPPFLEMLGLLDHKTLHEDVFPVDRDLLSHVPTQNGLAEFRSGTQRHLSQKRRHLDCQTICFPTVCKALIGHSLSFNQPSCGYCSVCLQ